MAHNQGFVIALVLEITNLFGLKLVDAFNVDWKNIIKVYQLYTHCSLIYNASVGLFLLIMFVLLKFSVG